MAWKVEEDAAAERPGGLVAADGAVQYRERAAQGKDLVQCLADTGQLSFVNGIFHEFGAQRGALELAATFHGTAASGVIDDQPPHRTRRP